MTERTTFASEKFSGRGTAKNLWSTTLRWFRSLMMLAAFACSVWFNFSGVVSKAEGSDGDVDAYEAVQSIGSSSWYDPKTDGYKRPTVKKLSDNPLRNDGWVAEKQNERKKKQQANTGGTRGGWFSGVDTSLFSAIVLTCLAVLLIVVIGLLAFHSLRNYMPGKWEPKEKARSIEIDPMKIQDLPFEVQRATHANPLAEAEALMRAGRYDQAMIFLYGYMLLALDQSRKIELQKGKTNRMYMRELKNQPPLKSLVEQVMLGFEDVYFGKHPIGKERFAAVWARVEEFHQLITGQQSPVAFSDATTGGKGHDNSSGPEVIPA